MMMDFLSEPTLLSVSSPPPLPRKAWKTKALLAEGSCAPKLRRNPSQELTRRATLNDFDRPIRHSTTDVDVTRMTRQGLLELTKVPKDKLQIVPKPKSNTCLKRQEVPNNRLCGTLGRICGSRTRRTKRECL